MDTNFHALLNEKLLEWGASFAGFSNIAGKQDQSLKDLNFAVTVGVRLSDFIIDEISDKPTFTYFHHYRTVNALIDQITLRAMLMILDKGFKAMAVPASQTVNDKEDNYCGIFPHKTAAVRAGLGWIGRNGLFISEDYGPRVRLGTILTNMELPAEGMKEFEGCKTCKCCVQHRPAIALTGNLWTEGVERGHVVDAKACSDYMNTNFKHIGRGSVCGICLKVCPQGKKRTVYSKS